MAARTPQTYLDVADAAWRWVLDQGRWEDGPWFPGIVDPAADPAEVPEVPEDRDSLHSGVRGLAHVLAEIRLARPWTAEEQRLADGIVERLRAEAATRTDSTYFDGLVSDIGALSALDAPGTDAAVARLSELATPDGWPQAIVVPPRALPDSRIHDVTLGTAGVLLGALWCRQRGVPGAEPLAQHAVEVLLAEAEETPAGTNWRFVPQRFYVEGGNTQMPNFSHGLAGIAAALAVAGAELDRPDVVEAARSGAAHLLSLGEVSDQGLRVPRYLPTDLNDEDEFTYTWCHGSAGTSLLFTALDRAGVAEVSGERPLDWHRRCLHGIRTSGLPERLYPGFWDNDGRCCGTAGVADVFLDSWQRAGHAADLEFALHLADVLVERAVREGPHACWRFIEHRADDPLLPPRVGWMQGAAGIAAVLFRAARLLREGDDAACLPRLDTWWALPPAT